MAIFSQRVKHGLGVERDHKVVVTFKSQFDYEGRLFTSLSSVARNICGTPWSGPLFFGLKANRKEAA